MKLKCIRDATDVLNFFQTKVVGEEKVPLKIGKIYEGQIIATFGDMGPSSEDWNEFLVYNERGEWVSYPLKLFKPE